MHIWTLTDDKAGNQTQALALAQAIAQSVTKTNDDTESFPVTISQKIVSASLPWRWLPPKLWFKNTTAVAQNIIPNDAQDIPDMVVSCGRQSIGASRFLRKHHQTFTVHIQNPRVNLDDFDVVVIPLHDRVTGDNVIVSDGGISRFNRTHLDGVQQQTINTYAHLPHPIIAVCIGGENKAYTITDAFIERICVKLKALAQDTGGSLLVTPSRRTGVENTAKLQRSLSHVRGIFWDGTGHNPYEEFLAHAHMCIVTNESVNMVTDCMATEKPVYVIQLPQKTSPIGKFLNRGRKFDYFIQLALQKGAIYPIEKIKEYAQNKAPLKTKQSNQTEAIAQQIVQRYQEHKSK